MHDLIVWFQEIVVPKLGWFGMFLVALADSSFVSLPEASDLLIVTGASSNPASAWKFVLATALGSGLGCQALYEVGRRGGERLALRFASKERLLWAENVLAKWGSLALAVAALSPPPMPFKVFVLGAGIFAMRRVQFFATVFLARGLRCAIWAILGVTYGDVAVAWLRSFDLWLAAHRFQVGIAFAAVAGLCVLVWRARRGGVANIENVG